jgi:hypothetical protein
MDVGSDAVNATRLFLGAPEEVSAHTTDAQECGVDIASIRYVTAVQIPSRAARRRPLLLDG